MQKGRTRRLPRVLSALAVALLAAVPALALTALGPGLFAFEAPSVVPSADTPAAQAPAGPGTATLGEWQFTDHHHR